MSPGDFLRAVWPSEGIYCLATPFAIPNGPRKGQITYSHKTFDTIAAAETFVLNNRANNDIFFAVHTLKEHTRWNPHKTNTKTGEIGATEVRSHANMKASRSFFFDLDVGADPSKYDSAEEAGLELMRFCSVTNLPRPLVVLSGRGLHVYWPLAEALDSEDWRVEAAKLKQLARHHGLKADPMRTTDTSSVLRVVGTVNYKNRADPRSVKPLTSASETGAGIFVAMLDKAVIEAGIEIKAPLKLTTDDADILGSNMEREFTGPPVTLWAVLDACGQMRRLALSKGQYGEPEWYNGVIGVGRFVEEGHRRVQQMSEGHPGYTREATEDKLKQHESYRDGKTGKPLGPTSCAKLAEACGAAHEDICQACPFWGKVHGPLGAARFKDSAPPPTVIEMVGVTPVEVELPKAPAPYMRQKGSGISVRAKNANGDEEYNVIYEHDLYPIRRLSNPHQGTEQQVWHASLPRGDEKDFTLDADMLYDPRKFTSAISNQGIYPNRGHVLQLQEYMVAYIKQLQLLVDADAQSNHLGWTDDYSKFVLPDKILSVDGTAKTAQLSMGAQRASLHVHKKGDLNRQVELMDFFNRPQYLPNQFMILAGLGTPIFYATGHHGVIINASGDAGASKSTTLYAAASMWGQPELYPINGTNNGATVRGRNERVTVLANLPVCVDEITHLPVKDAIDLAMSITQPGHRIRLQTDGVERASLGSYKATIMLSTGNNSLHGLLSTDNAAGTAGSMRVFEILFNKTRCHTKNEADTFLHELKQNYGHFGELFVGYVMPQRMAIEARMREKVKLIDEELGIQASERFWSAGIAEVLVTGEIANSIGLLSYNPLELKEWAYDVQVPHMRGVVREEYSDPLSVVMDYLDAISSNMVVMEKSKHATMDITNIQRKPTGALLAHYDIDERMLYVSRKAFKDHCARIGANSRKVLDDLNRSREGGPVVPNTYIKRTLGAGTEYGKGQTWCFSINTAHPEVSGKAELKIHLGGGQSGVEMKAPTLTIVP